MLDASADTVEYQTISPQWFARVPGAVAHAGQAVVGPLSAAVGGSGGNWRSQAEVAQWIVRLTPEATQEAGSVAGVAELLNRSLCRFEVMRGLGLPGQLLVRADAMTEEVRGALAGNSSVATFEPNAYFFAQANPNDPDFSTLTGLNNSGQFGATVDSDIDAPEAWDENTGSTNVVVGVIDSGIDYTHPDLYLNIWINQGEIPELLKSQLVDTDADGRITFYDLNETANASCVSNLNSNTYIDAGDLFADPRWTDGVDTDRNSFVDDLVGWNFRSAVDEPFEPNNPQDVLGHGTHVAGTIGAIGNNNRGVTGINWRTSMMALKFLDDGNTGQTADAIASVNYATMMRTEYGENVRVINASWGQSGSESPALRAAMEASGEADVLFVAAAGNGNILGQGINLDRDPFFPAGSDLANVISVAASGPADELARFSNFGRTTVDLAAPGIGVLSTLPGGRYGTANGTSMSAPHVAGVAALILSELPFASSAEVKQAILGTVDTSSGFNTFFVTGGRLNADKALDSNVFAPRATLVNAPSISTAGGTQNLVTVTYRDRVGIDATTIGDGDIIATRQWGSPDIITATLVPGSIVSAASGAEITATYRIAAPGGTWDPLDFGGYELSVVPGQVRNATQLMVPSDPFGKFSVQVVAPGVFYVDASIDAVDATVGDGVCASTAGDCTLRAAIQESNAAGPAARTIILDAGTFELSLPPVPESPISFQLLSDGGCFENDSAFVSSDARSGDLDIRGNISIRGSSSSSTIVESLGLDRAFKVYPTAQLNLNSIAVKGGSADYGGGILSAGNLGLERALVTDNAASSNGGGIAVFDGETTITSSVVDSNRANRGGGVFVCNEATTDISASTLSNNVAIIRGGGVLSSYGGLVNVVNTTVSGNEGGAVEGNIIATFSFSPTLSSDGRFAAFDSGAFDLVQTNLRRDIFVLDRLHKRIERVSLANDGTPANSASDAPSISGDGRFVAFSSDATNLVPGDTNGRDLFVHDRQTNTIERIDGFAFSASLSFDGRYVAFASDSPNLVQGDSNAASDVFVFDRQSRVMERVSVTDNGSQANLSSTGGSISPDGRYVTFTSSATNLVSGDQNGKSDVFVYDRTTRRIERVSLTSTSAEGNGDSFAMMASNDGRLVAFGSSAINLVNGDTNNRADLFVFDRQSRTVERVVTEGGAVISPFEASFSGDIRYVTFENGSGNIFLFDRQARTTETITIAVDGGPANSGSQDAVISNDGKFATFRTFASNMVEADYSDDSDVLIYDRVQKAIEPIDGHGLIVLESSTIAENDAPAGCRLFASCNTSGRVIAHNSLFVRNSSDLGQVLSLGYNVTDRVALRGLDEVTPPVSDRIVASAGNTVGPLQANGGPTPTHALLPASPAVDAGDPANGVTTDQRGVARPQFGGGISERRDIGAFEAYEGQIRGAVYVDRNRNGVRDNVEPGLAGQQVYLDANKNGQLDAGELSLVTAAEDPGTAAESELGTFVFSPIPGAHRFESLVSENYSRTSAPRLARASESVGGDVGDNHTYSPALNTDGRFLAFSSFATNLVNGDTNGKQDVFLSDRQSGDITRLSVASDGTQANAESQSPVISGNGRFVAFASLASNLASGDTNGTWDIFVYDRQNRTLERVSVANDGTGGNGESHLPAISADGRFITYRSEATNLVAADTNARRDIFVYDRLNRTTERVGVSSTGAQSIGGDSNAPSISGDGRFVSFESSATNLVTGDTNAREDVFVFDRQNRTIERISVAAGGAQGNHDSDDAVITPNGRFVAFRSRASNFVSGDGNSTYDVFVYDRQQLALQRLTSTNGGFLIDPVISDDGRFVSFVSEASNLVPNDNNGSSDVFLHDRQTSSTQRVSVSEAGAESIEPGAIFGFYQETALSGDGRLVAFASAADGLISSSSVSISQAYLSRNSNAVGAAAKAVSIFGGQVVANVNFGVVPDAGELRGRCFDDVIANGLRDEGEPGRSGCIVYLDANSNGRFNSDEVSTVSAADGSYAFTNLDTEQEYRIAVIIPADQSLVLPTPQQAGAWRVFLPAGATIVDRDFGVRPASTVGQFENGVIQGRLFVDQPGAIKPGIAGIGLFVDLDDDGVRDFNEPRTISAIDDPATSGVNEAGQYTFAGLGTRPYTVRVQDLPPNVQQKTPIGNSFARQPFSLASPTRLLGSPLDVVVDDFNNDGWPDLATVVFDGNAVSILLNDGQGGFVPTPIDISLAPAGRPTSHPRGTGPIALVAGNFNGLGGADLAVANSFSSNVAVLLDFNGSGFASEKYINVGLVPTGIASGDLETDGDLDLVVTNNLENATGTVKNVSLLRNNGQGTFTAIINLPSAGNNPSAVVTGHFNNDTLLDLAIADFGTHPRGADLGDVRVLLANANGTFQSSNACGIGFGPSALTTADLNGDQQLDLAVANFLSDNVTICLGNGSGGFQSRFTLSGGSGPTDIAATDIDNDDDLDLLITNGKTQKVGILRSRRSQGIFEFDPAESFGAAQFAGVTRLSFAAGDLDRDGDVDLATASSERNEVSVHRNALVSGAQRRSLNGVETLVGIDFAFRALNLPPTLDAISSPAAVNEDSGVVVVGIAGISAGMGENQPLRVTVSSDNPGLFASATVLHQGADSSGSVQLTLAENQSGQAIITVNVTDGGLDDDLNTSGDNLSTQQSFTVAVNPLDDPPTVLADTFDVLLGGGPYFLDVLGNDSIAPDLDETLTLIFVVPPATAVGTLAIESNRLKYTPAPAFKGSFTTQYFVSDGGVPIFVDVSIAVNDSTENPWFNAVKPLDVTGDGSIVADDALAVINFLNAFGSQRVPTNASAGGPFYDVNGDRSVVAGDALDVINFLNAFGPESEGEPAAWPLIASDTAQPHRSDHALPLDELLSQLALDVVSQPRRRRS